LKKDFETPVLAPWKSAAHVNFIDINDASQAQRQNAFGVSKTTATFPVILLYPPKGHPRYPYYVVYRKSGYDGDEAKLSHALYHSAFLFTKAVKSTPAQSDVAESLSVIHSQMAADDEAGCFLCWRRNRGTSNRPTPIQKPVVVDVDVDLPLPNIPDFEPVDEEDEPEVATAGIPQHPQVTIIYDPSGIGEEARLDCLKQLAFEEVNKYSFNGPKGRILDVNSEDAKTFPVGPEGCPAIFITDQGKILGAVSRPALLPLIRGLLGGEVDVPENPITTTVDYERIISALFAKMKSDAAFRGADGKDGSDGTSLDENSVVAKLVDRIKADDKLLALLKGPKGDPGDTPTIELPNKERHIVIVADRNAGYWQRLSGEIASAQGHYSAIRIADPPSFSTPLPQLVVFEEGKSVHRSEGLYNVSSDLAQIMRGTFPAESAGRH